MPVIFMAAAIACALSARSAILYLCRPTRARAGGSQMRLDWQGVAPALTTEFTQDGALDVRRALETRPRVA